MAIVATTISAAISATDLVIPVTSATGFAAGYVMRIDNEFMLVHPTYVSGTNIPVYRRGDLGSQQVAHILLAQVAVGVSTDWPLGGVATTAQVNPAGPDIVNIGADVTIVYPNKDTLYMIDKASACAITLSAPATKGTDGVIVRFYSNTAAAHTIAYTAGFHGNTTSSDVLTYAATAGQCVTLMSSRGLLGIVALGDGVTLG